MRKKQPFSCEEGYTLAEILVTIAIMAAILPALLKVFSDTSKNIGKADHNITALYLLQSKMAEIEANGFPEVGHENDVFGGTSIFEWQTVVSDIETEEMLALRKVELTVSWEHLNKVNSISMFTYMADRAVQQQQGQ